jgi:hypothetical protein
MQKRKGRPIRHWAMAVMILPLQMLPVAARAQASHAHEPIFSRGWPNSDRILFPMLESFAKGDFQGYCANKKSKDWKMWNGTCTGYEGLLVDNYYALLAVLDREAALKRMM